MHGDADPVVPFSQAEMMEKALKAAGVATKLRSRTRRGAWPHFRGSAKCTGLPERDGALA